MRLSVVGDRIRLRGTLRELVVRRLYFALNRFSPEIAQVTVRVGDANGPRGGPIKMPDRGEAEGAGECCQRCPRRGVRVSGGCRR